MELFYVARKGDTDGPAFKHNVERFDLAMRESKEGPASRSVPGLSEPKNKKKDSGDASLLAAVGSINARLDTLNGLFRAYALARFVSLSLL